ncbi:MAG: FAD-binding oxidoreductase [Propioniciclava sp.]
MTTSAGALEALTDALGDIGLDRSPLARQAYARDAYPVAVKAEVAGSPPLGRPDGVVRPRTVAEVVETVRACGRLGIPVVAYGGGSGICGSALATEGGIVIDTKLLNRIESLDPVSGLATVGAGMLGTELEWALNGAGFTCGHSPQSVGSSTVGGWVAHRGAGVFSTRYGKIDDLVQGLEVVLPSGEVLDTVIGPTSAAGPDLNRLFLGAEGTLGIITRATLKVFALPATVEHASWAFPDLESGLALGRTLLQAGYRPSVVRLYDPVEVAHQFPDLGLPPGQCVVLIRAEGDPDLVRLTLDRAAAGAVRSSGTPLGQAVGEAWGINRFSTAGLVRTLQQRDGVADALEVVNTYAGLPNTYTAMSAALRETARIAGVGIEVFGHASHFYDTGANLYMIFHVHGAAPEQIDAVYDSLVRAALEACRATGGSITHHHGVGISKSALMSAEWGRTGVDLWRGIKASIDPLNLMNPGDKVVHRGLS